MRAGGGFVGIHNAFGTEYNWPYYEGLLGNANYYDHGANQPGMAHVTGSPDPSTAGLPASFETIDEWYNLMPYPTNVKFLLRLDETTLANRRDDAPRPRQLPPGVVVPVLRRRPFVGDDARPRPRVTSYDGTGFAGQAHFKQHIVQGIKSAMGLLPFCTR